MQTNAIKSSGDAVTQGAAVLVSHRGARVDVCLQAPHRRNALDVAMWRDLHAAFSEVALDDAVRVIVVRGAEGHFAGGADISEFPQVRHDPRSARDFHLDLLLPALRAIVTAPQVVIAAIEGACVGGGLEVAMACDLRVAAASARFGVPIGRLGFPLALPEMQLMLQRLPAPIVADLLLTGRLLDANEALQHGLVQRLAGSADLDLSVDALVADVQAGSPLAARLNKAQLRQLLDDGLRLEPVQIEASFCCYSSNDYAEGVAAFLAHRPAKFTGT